MNKIVIGLMKDELGGKIMMMITMLKKLKKQKIM